jgi:hypothetical protein
MHAWTSDDLRARYRELLRAFETKTAQDNDMEELMAICRMLTERGYILNIDSSDWILEFSSSTWRLEDET